MNLKRKAEEEKEPTAEEIHAYQIKRARREDPMAHFVE